MKKVSGTTKNKSIQAMRALAFLGIFLQHAGVSVAWSALGVSLFFVLSGFLLMQSSFDKTMACSIKENILFSWNKIKKLYPLHIITMLCASVIFILRNGFAKDMVLKLCKNLFLNITLLQTWVPSVEYNVSLNGVAWYLSVAMFLYFLFPYIVKLFQNIHSAWLVLVLCFSVLAFQVIISVLSYNVYGIDGSFYTWATYCWPIFRVGDFVFGCSLGYWWLAKSEIKISPQIATLLEVSVFILAIIAISWNKKEHIVYFINAINNWTTIYIPVVSLFVIIFYHNKGYITRLLSNRILIFIGDISPYCFLIHYVIIQAIRFWVESLNLNLTEAQNNSTIMLEFVLTVLFSYMYIPFK